MILTRTCPKCKGAMEYQLEEYEPEYACLNCGKRISLEDMEVFMAKKREVEANNLKQPEVASNSTMPPVPPKPETTSHRAIHGYYVENRDAILRDLAELGQKKTMERWGIKSGSSMHLIRHGWKGQKPKEKSVSKGEKTRSLQESPKTPSNTKVTKGDRYIYLGTFTVVAADGLPSLPEFDNSWPMLTQIEWLQTYRELKKLNQ